MSVASVPYSLDQSTSSLWSLIDRQATTFPHASAILAPGRSPLTYELLRQQAVATATWLNVRGICCRDRVAMVLPDGPEAAVAFLVLSASVTCAPLNPNLSASEFEYYLSDLHPKALLVAAGSQSPAIAAARRLGIEVLEMCPESELEAGRFTLGDVYASGDQNGCMAQPDDVALLLYTSGTSTRPKLAPLTHRNLWCAAQSICQALQLTHADSCFNVMPLFHIHGLSMIYASLTVGASVVCVPEFSGESFFRGLREFSPTWYSAAPAIHQIILQHAQRFPADAENVRLRFLRSASAPMPPRAMAELESLFQAPFIEAYGMTEAGPQIASNRLPPHPRKPGSVGPAAGPEISILDETGNSLPPGGIGEVAIRGPNVISAYIDSQANEHAFVNGWFRTGDQGRLDSDGHLYITGRLKEFINRGGEKISPREIDDALLDHPAVVQAVAYSVPHAVLGEDIAAAIVLDPKFTPNWRTDDGSSLTEQLIQDIRRIVAKRLAPFKIPQTIEIVDQLPNFAGGKMRRIDLAHRLRQAISPPQKQVASGMHRTATERLLCEIWADVLAIALPGINDNFFALGGHSLAASQVVARVESKFSIQLPVTTLFDCPTVAELAVRVGRQLADLVADGQFCISSNRISSEASVHTVGISRRAETGPCELSFAQQRMWFLSQITTGAAYHVSATLHLTGPVDEAALRRSFDEILRRHESLRTTFHWRDEQPVQIIEAPQPCKLPVIDLTSLPPSDRAIEAQRVAAEETQRPFDLEQGPLVRTALIRVNAHEHWLLITMHHIVSDGWSIEVLHRELRSLYNAFSAGEPSTLAELPCRYVDYAHWQRERIGGNSLEPVLAYWRRQLQQLPPPLELPTDRPRGAIRTSRGTKFQSAIDGTTAAQLRSLSEREGSTLFMTCLAAFKTLLMRQTGQHDVVVGSPIAHRTERETEDLIGFFANTLVLRTNLSGNPSFCDLLARVRRTALDAYAHQNAPFDKLVDELQPERDPSRMPLFQVMFAFQNYPRTATTLSRCGMRTIEFAGGLVGRPSPIDSAGAKFDLTLYLAEGDAGLQTSWQYNADLYDQITIERLDARFQTLLRSIAADPQQRLTELPIVSGDEARQVSTWSRAVEASQPASSFLDAFSVQVATAPHSVAVECGDELLTYAELDERANQLARHLQQAGVGPETLVGICLPRSTQMVVSLFAVWKAGGAYLPLDPEYPSDRIAYLLRDSQLSILVTSTAGKSRIESYVGPQMKFICWDVDQEAIARAGRQPLQSSAALHNLAYVIYTSGSTGSPKGVMITHGNVGHYVAAMRAALHIEANDRYLHTASFAFSSSVRQWTLPLACGATVVIASTDQCRDPEALFALVRSRRVSILDLVPSLWQSCWQLFECLAPATRALLLDNELRLLLSASEPLSADLARKCADLASGARLINMYGQTETTGIVTTTAHSTMGVMDGSLVPVGLPIANTQLHVLDAQQRPTPIEVAGEAYVGGLGVGRGYWNRPELTAKSFVVDPSQPQTGSLLYRTGDIVRRRGDGTIEFLGRADQQIKIRGHRIEPAEVETAIMQSPGVREVAVLGGERLTAIVARHSSAPDTEPPKRPMQSDWTCEIRDLLRRKLPDYLVPSLILECQSLPRNAHGKLDRAELLAMIAVELEEPSVPRQITQSRPIQAPRNDIESAMVKIWQRVLRRDDISVDDNFFDVGGDSLLSVRVISQAKSVGLELDLSQLFQYQTIAELALMIEKASTLSTPNFARAKLLGDDASAQDDATIFVEVEELRRYGREALESVGLAARGAEIVTEVQIEATLRGQPTHNFASIPRYARRIAARKINPQPQFRIERETAVSALVDGDNGPGQWVAMTAMTIAIAKAQESGIAVVSVRRSNHFGAAGQYVWQAARAGLIGLATTNGPVILAPTGGVTPTFGNNPLAVGIPAAQYDPILLDAAMSVAPRGKIGLYVAEGKPLPPGWILDRFGRPSTDLADLAAGLGVPIGGHKGYGIALAMEILSGVLSGAGFGWDHTRQRTWQNTAPPDIGHFFVVFDPQLFMPLPEFTTRVDKMIEQTKSGERAECAAEILIPGEAELRARDWHLKHGAPLRPSAYRSLTDYAVRAGLNAKLTCLTHSRGS